MDASELAEQCVRVLHGRDLAARSLGIRILESGPGESRLSMQVRQDMCNGHGICHGGVLFTLADTAMAYASNSRGQVAVASTVQIDYLRSVNYPETVIAQAEETYRGRRKGSYQVSVSDGAGLKIAHFYGTVAILDKQVLDKQSGDIS
jgi:acyl-CoA thioesterase